MYKLIIIDDEQEIRSGLSNYFPWDEIGFVVVGTFESPLPALDYLAASPVDAVLSDVKMPKMSGLDFAKRLQAMKRPPKIVFLSGYKEFDLLKEAMDYRVFNYLLKPVTPAEIRKTFSSLRDEFDEVRTKTSGEGAARETEYVSSVQALLDYLEKNYSTTSLEDAASFIHMNPNYLSKFFKQKTGENFSDHLLKLKMRNALALMNDHGLKTYHISERVGYNNPNNFTRAFKRLFGKSPKDYRNAR